MPRKVAKMNVKPIQFNFSEEAYNDLSNLKQKLNVSSKTEVIRLALAVLSWLVDELEAGHTVLAQREPSKATELVFPFLRVKAQRERSSEAETAGG
jgi:hypothetical protein